MADQTPSGRIVKTKRVSHTITSPEVTAGFVRITATWDSPFQDMNYVVTCSLEVQAPADTSDFGISGFTRDQNGLTADVFFAGFTTNPPLGTVMVLHAVAIHD